MPAHLRHIHVVHTRAFQPPIGQNEPQRLHEIDRGPKAGGEPQHGADILWNFGLDKGDAHTIKHSGRKNWKWAFPSAPFTRHNDAWTVKPLGQNGFLGLSLFRNFRTARGFARMSDSAEAAAATAADNGGMDEGRRDFLYMAAGAMGAVGLAAAVWPFIDTMNPAADTLALSSTEVDLSPIQVGQSITVVWRGKPVFIRRRTDAEIETARNVDLDDLRDPQPDSDRVKSGEDQWLVLVGVCTHLGCIPLGQKAGDPHGDFGGWFCPCHGSHYDTSGRIRKGPAPANLAVPPYDFLPNARIKIG